MKNAIVLGLAIMFGTVNAMADCDSDPVSNYEINDAPIVPAWSYAESIKLSDEDVPFPMCEAQAEMTRCKGKHGLSCAREMQTIYSLCVARDVCDRFVTKAITDQTIQDLDSTEDTYQNCVNVVLAMGGDY